MSAEMLSAALSPPTAQEVGRNLLGQRLGRKGLETRERILAAALRLLDSPQSASITLTAVSREASVGMTTLYLYFPDLGELVLAALTRVMDSADAAFMDRLRTRWPDDTLGECCLGFMQAHYKFWHHHAGILHLRNSYADASDLRFVEYRQRMTHPMMGLIVMQMDGPPDNRDAACWDIATVLLTGFERVATVVTNPNFRVASSVSAADEPVYIDRLIRAEARVIEVVIRDQRAP